MTWPELENWIRNLKKQLAVYQNVKIPLPEGSDSLQNKYLKIEKSMRGAVDEAVRVFGNDLRLPKIEPLVGYFLFQRVDYVAPFALLLAVRRTGEENPILPNPPPEFDDATQIEWLLNTGWEILGCFWWLGRVSSGGGD